MSNVAFWLNVLGLGCGMAGAALIFLFGVPRQTDTGGVNYLTLSGDQRYNAEELARIKRFKGRGQLGLGFVFLAFCLQLAGLIVVGHA